MAFLTLYYILNIIYRTVLDPDQKKIFEDITQYCETFNDLIPLSFVLGFYVSIVMTRWWNQYVSIPWPDPIAVFVSSNIHGQDERGRVMRRTIMRYVCLCLTMVFSNISPRVKKRFPTLEHFVEAGLLTDNERSIMSDLNEKFPRHSKHWLPIVWAASIVTRARKEGRIRDDFAVKTIIDELNKFRGQCGLLLSFDTISIPLVYTQVVTLAVYSYFITSVMGRQWLEVTDDNHPLYKHHNSIDLYFPFFTTLQFFFYMGWLKVAESLINPFGEDDDDFEVNWLVDRNLQVSYMIVDEMHHEHPELIKDQYWDEVFPTQLPYTVAAEAFREEHPQPSTANIEVPRTNADLGKGDGAVFDDATSGIHFTAPKRSMSRSSTRGRMTSAGSASSISTHAGSMAASLHRVGSVTSVLRRLFSRDGAPSGATPMGTGSTADGLPQASYGAGGTRLASSGSSASLPAKQWGGATGLAGGGSVRIADQVIEEVDEQSTVTSMRQPEMRPSVRNIFPSGPPTPSAPVAVPMGSDGQHHSHPRAQSHHGHTQHMGVPTGHSPLSSSAPATAGPPSAVSPAPSGSTYTEVMSVRSAPGPGGGVDPVVGSSGGGHEGGVRDPGDRRSSNTSAMGGGDGDTLSLGGSSTTSGGSEDEFSRLKAARDRERRQRLVARLARSVSAQGGAGDTLASDTEQLLMGLLPGTRIVSPRSSLFGDANV